MTGSTCGTSACLIRRLGLAIGLLTLVVGCSSSNSTGRSGSGGATNAGTAGKTTPPASTGGSGGGTGAGNAGGAGRAGSAGMAGAAGASPPSACGTPGTSQIPRLTSAQYGRTVRDLLGVTSLPAMGNLSPAALLAPDPDRTSGLTDLAWTRYLAASEAIAAQVMATPDQRRRFMACTPSGDGAACLHDTIIAFGRRAFRRPLTVPEVARFDKLVSGRAQITPTGAADEVAEVILQTFLVSASFIQRSEISAPTPQADGTFVLSPYEVASRLSYMLWGSTPDDLLDQAADAGALTTKEQLRKQAVRMLQDDKAREPVAAFHRSYLLMGAPGSWSPVKKDPALFPAFNDAVVAAMTEETETFFDTVVFKQNGSFSDLFASPLGFVNAATAPLYGLDPSRFGPTLQQVTLDASQRPGFLTRVGFLAAFSSYNRSSPMRRGAFIARQVLGVTFPDVPTADAPPPPANGNSQTNRQQVEGITVASDCAACHKTIINPPGFVLEAYDAVGTWRKTEADTGLPIDTVAEMVIDGAPVTVRDPADLMRRLATSQDARRTYARRWVAAAYERDGQPLDQCTVDNLTANLSGTGYTLLDLLVDLTQTASFRLRASEVTP